MSYFVFSISVENEKWNLETRISIFSITLKRKSENQVEVFCNFPNFYFQFLKKMNGHLGIHINNPSKDLLMKFNTELCNSPKGWNYNMKIMQMFTL